MGAAFLPRPGLSTVAADMRGKKFSYNISLPWRERYVDGISFVPSFERDTPFCRMSSERCCANGDPEDVMYRYFDQAPAKDPVSQMLYVDTKTYMVADILTKVDRMSMATSLEVRVPILDHVFVEWATGLPPDWKLRGGKQKYILRKLAERVGVPREVLYRPKQGFAMPLVHWMRNELKEIDPDRAAGSTNTAARVLRSSRRAAVAGRAFSGAPQSFWPNLAFVDVRAVASQLPGENRRNGGE